MYIFNLNLKAYPLEEILILLVTEEKSKTIICDRMLSLGT